MLFSVPVTPPHDTGEDREVLQVVRPGIAVARVVRRDAVVAEIDAQGRVAEDAVAVDQVAASRR